MSNLRKYIDIINEDFNEPSPRPDRRAGDLRQDMLDHLEELGRALNAGDTEKALEMYSILVQLVDENL